MSLFKVRKCAVRVAHACSKIGHFKKAREYLKEVELGFPKEKLDHPEFASFLQRKTEITLDSFEISWPLDEERVQQIKAEAQSDLLRAEEILDKSLGCNHQQYAVVKKEKARLNIHMGHYQVAYDEICSALNIILNHCNQRRQVGHYLKAEFSLIRSDAEGKLALNSGQKESLKTAKDIYRNALGNNHPMVAFTLQKLCIRYLELECLKDADKYFEESENICQILRKDLQSQLDSSNSDFLVEYKLDSHPILKGQQRLLTRITRNHGAW